MSPDAGETPMTPNIGRAGNETWSFIVTTPSTTLKMRVVGEFTVSIELPPLGDAHRRALFVRPDVEQRHRERVAGFAAAHPDRAGRAIDPGEVDLLERVLFALHLSGEAVPRLDLDDRPGVDHDHGLARCVKGPDMVVTTDLHLGALHKFSVRSCVS